MLPFHNTSLHIKYTKYGSLCQALSIWHICLELNFARNIGWGHIITRGVLGRFAWGGGITYRTGHVPPVTYIPGTHSLRWWEVHTLYLVHSIPSSVSLIHPTYRTAFGGYITYPLGSCVTYITIPDADNPASTDNFAFQKGTTGVKKGTFETLPISSITAVKTYIILNSLCCGFI